MYHIRLDSTSAPQRQHSHAHAAMPASDRYIVPVLDTEPPLYTNYLPDELLLEILNYIPRDRENQSTIAKFCAVSRYVYSQHPYHTLP